MEIETLGAWGEFVGGIAVVLTLIYLAFQIYEQNFIKIGGIPLLILASAVENGL